MLCTPISGACIEIGLLWSEVEMCFFSETLVFSRRHISELLVPGFGKPMHLLRGEFDQFRELAVYVRNDFSVYRRVVMSGDVVKS